MDVGFCNYNLSTWLAQRYGLPASHSLFGDRLFLYGLLFDNTMLRIRQRGTASHEIASHSPLDPFSLLHEGRMKSATHERASYCACLT